MEKQLFTYKSWDILDVMVFQFYDCVLKTQIGEYSPGTEINAIGIDYDKGQLQLFDDNAQPLCPAFKISLKVENEN